MVHIKQFIENLADRKVNEDIYIKDGIVYLNNGEYEYKYQNDCWFIKAGDNWVNMQGGIPAYEVEENLDADIFVEVAHE